MALLRRAVPILAVLAAACTFEADRVTDVVQVNLPAANVTAGCYEDPSHSSEFFSRIWHCDDVIAVQVSPAGSPYAGSILTAKTNWNSALPTGYGLPRFSQSGVPATPGKVVTVILNTSGGSADNPHWCGLTDQSANQVTLSRVAQGAICPLWPTNLIVDDLVALATHELGHALGFSTVHLSDRAPEATTGDCVMYVSDHFNSAPCPLEPQIMLWSFGQRSTEPDETTDLRDVSVPALTPSAPTVQPNQSIAMYATTTEGGLSTSDIVTWSSSNPSVASLTPGGGMAHTATALGIAVGTTTITARVEAPNVLWPAKRSVLLRVVAPTPLEIWIDGPTEVLPAATCSWFASVIGGAEPYTLQWSGFGTGTEWNTTVQVPSGGGTLYLDVWDGNGSHASAALPVSESPTANICNQ